MRKIKWYILEIVKIVKSGESMNIGFLKGPSFRYGISSPPKINFKVKFPFHKGLLVDLRDRKNLSMSRVKKSFPYNTKFTAKKIVKRRPAWPWKGFSRHV